jgi:hypothetical protein
MIEMKLHELKTGIKQRQKRGGGGMKDDIKPNKKRENAIKH